MDWSFLENKEWEPLDIGSGKDYPSNALSNFAPHPFVIDGSNVTQWKDSFNR